MTTPRNATDAVNAKKAEKAVKYLKDQINTIDVAISKLEEEVAALLVKRNQLENQIKMKGY